MRDNILCTIVNHNKNKETAELYKTISKKLQTEVIDSGSHNPDNSWHCLPNVWYSGLLNYAYELLEKSGKEWLFFICSDVKLDEKNLDIMLKRIDPSFGMYTPSAYGRAHQPCQNQGTGTIRKVEFLEGFCFLVRKQVLDKMMPIDLKINPIGWGLDLEKSWICKEMKIPVMVDDGCFVYHPHESGSNWTEAKRQMDAYVKTKPIEFKEFINKTKLFG